MAGETLYKFYKYLTFTFIVKKKKNNLRLKYLGSVCFLNFTITKIINKKYVF